MHCAGDYNYALERDKRGAQPRPASSARQLRQPVESADSHKLERGMSGSAAAQDLVAAYRGAPSLQDGTSGHAQQAASTRPTQQNAARAPQHAVRAPDISAQTSLAAQARQMQEASISSPPASSMEARQRRAAADKHYQQGYAMRKAVCAWLTQVFPAKLALHSKQLCDPAVIPTVCRA